MPGPKDLHDQYPRKSVLKTPAQITMNSANLVHNRGRRSGDSVNPRVGVQGVIAGKPDYSQKSDRIETIVIIVVSDPNPPAVNCCDLEVTRLVSFEQRKSRRESLIII
jgi:hypothetical protein